MKRSWIAALLALVALFGITAGASASDLALALDDEDCVSLDPDQIQALPVQDSWKMVDNDRWLMDFGAARIQAYTALAIVRHHGFSHQCFVARPGPALTYLRRDGDQPG